MIYFLLTKLSTKKENGKADVVGSSLGRPRKQLFGRLHFQRVFLGLGRWEHGAPAPQLWWRRRWAQWHGLCGRGRWPDVALWHRAVAGGFDGHASTFGQQVGP